ncbi:efflux RND transporter periplasmic adaptor subunit [Dechloromonas sp. ZY10]|uniref:efflux RND transporter periplasmic adaptor subunit n=1 Tax=Dechloromonas aquae TaxID=2664436 RepID=UPI0035283B0B
MKAKSKIVIFSLLTVGFLVAAGWYQKQREAGRPEQRFRSQTVERGEVVQSVSANGTLNPVVLVNVGTQVSGTVRKLYVDFNDKVSAGQALLELDDALLAAQAKQSEAGVANAEAALELAQANATRMQSLYAQEYVSRQEFEQSQQALKSARAQLALARAQWQKDKVNHGNTVIRSPVSGVVVDRVVDLGQTVAASFQTPVLIKIAQDLSEMRIDTSFAEADIGNIREGQKARFTVDAFPNRNFTGEVQQIRLNPTNQQNVVTYNVRITVANPEQVLLPGMTAYVNIAVARREDVLLVPNAALRFKLPDDVRPDADKPAAGDAAKGGGAAGRKGKRGDGQQGTVQVLLGDEIRPVAVQLGITDNRNTEVIGGELKPGDRVIVGENGASKKPSSLGMRMF